MVLHVDDNRATLITIGFDAEECESRLIHTRPNMWRYRGGYEEAKNAKNHLAASFYLDRWLSVESHRADLYKLRDDDQRLIARASFHHAELANTPYDRGVVEAMAVAGDRLAKRLVAQERFAKANRKWRSLCFTSVC